LAQNIGMDLGNELDVAIWSLSRNYHWMS